MISRTLAILSLLTMGPLAAVAEEARPGPGRSTHHVEGLRVEFLVPPTEKMKDGVSLLVILPGMGGEAANMVGTGQPMLEKGFVTIAPKSTRGFRHPCCQERHGAQAGPPRPRCRRYHRQW